VQLSAFITGWMNTQQFDVGFSMPPVERPGLEIESFDAAPGFCALRMVDDFTRECLPRKRQPTA
jgi:hypothetical protein